MQTDSKPLTRARLKTIPYSRVNYPNSPIGIVRKGFWRAYTPLHHLLRNSLVASNAFKDGNPKDFLGKVAPHSSIDELVDFLVGRGYGNHFVAWKFKGEVVSLRYLENFSNQYHIRVFNDGSVCGHYERTPESHPILHMKDFFYVKVRKMEIEETGIETRPEYFYELLGDFIVKE